MRSLKIIAAVLLSVAALAYLINSGDDAYDQSVRWAKILFAKKKKPEPDEGMLAGEELRKLVERRVRKQIVSFSKVQPLVLVEGDLFMVGVSQVYLDEAESFDTGEDTIIVTGSRIAARPPALEHMRSGEFIPYPPEAMTGEFNNVILFDRKADTLDVIFDKRVLIYSAESEWSKQPRYIILFGAIEDTNGDDQLTEDDARGVYYYDIRSKVLKSVQLQDAKPVGVVSLYQSDYFLVRTIIDHDKDKKFRESWEDTGRNDPERVLRVDFETGEVSDFIPENIRMELQKRLQGEEP